MSTKLHPEIASDLVDTESKTKDGGTRKALERATTRRSDTAGAQDESGEDKLRRAAEHNDRGGSPAGKDKAQ